MIAGHFGLAAALKSRETATPLWALMLATVWLDVVFMPLFLAHVETLKAVSGPPGAYGGAVIFADYTHSLIGAGALSAVLGLSAARLWGARSGIVIGAVAVSHWILDLVTHRADMPILPGNLGDLPRLGLGLWRWPAASAAVELGLVVLGAALYWNAARKAARQAGRGAVLPAVVGGLAMTFGVLVLALDVFAAR
jgi:hypothetical protein